MYIELYYSTDKIKNNEMDSGLVELRGVTYSFLVGKPEREATRKT
jgi:hypothetical protein